MHWKIETFSDSNAHSGQKLGLLRSGGFAVRPLLLPAPSVYVQRRDARDVSDAGVWVRIMHIWEIRATRYLIKFLIRSTMAVKNILHFRSLFPLSHPQRMLMQFSAPALAMIMQFQKHVQSPNQVCHWQHRHAHRSVWRPDPSDHCGVPARIRKFYFNNLNY